MNDDELFHVGVLGMKWGRGRAASAAKAQGRDAKSLREHGYKKEAAAVQKMSNANRKKAQSLTQKINRIDKAKLQKRYGHIKDVPLKDLRDEDARRKKQNRELAASALATIGTIYLLDQTLGKSLKLNLF